MSSETGNKIKISIFGESHGAAIGVTINGLPSGEKIDQDELRKFMKRRQGGNNPFSTPRKEADEVTFLSGVFNGFTTGAPLCAIIENNNTHSKDYNNDIPRPGHADYTAYVKYGGFSDYRGGGHFSGRLTAPLCIAGGILIQILKERGVDIISHIYSIGNVSDQPFDYILPDISKIDSDFPVLNSSVKAEMQQEILDAKKDMDSIGGVIECAVLGVSAGLGNPIFDGIENRIASTVFGIGAVKGIEFGIGFEAAKMRGSQVNDPFIIENGKIKTKSNNHGGILGGISSGMPIIFRTAFKPTPSIGKEQRSISLSNMAETTLNIVGRHDPCIVPRAIPCIESAAAIAIADFIL